ncbi:AI-2E family transporter [Allokutzneria sp. NRRL B-24872]|uniref:AI-2E family transporter n=1 Tax=Allokutzneria sp. NRRL B-24872 TaxID=1137961 RepID=UPI001FEE64CE|nr:AI-2E family transporter [Allokutzneria sp. NRRL B-24872]
MSAPRQIEPTPIRRDADEPIPYGIRVSAALAWRMLVIAGALVVLGYVAAYFATVVIPIAVALLLSALMGPAVKALVRWRVPKWAATTVVLVGGLALVIGVLTSVVTAFIEGVPDLQKQVTQSLETIRDWLINGPLHLKQEDITGYINQAIEALKANTSVITSGALSTAATVGEILTGFLLVLFTLIFFLHDGQGIWRGLLKAVPTRIRNRVDVAGSKGFDSLSAYVKATVLVAVVDAVGIGIGLIAVGVPLAIPLAALVFLGAFIPIVGGLLAGTVAVLVALVANGFVSALIVLVIVIAVMQLESHVLQPLLLGKAVQLHPLAVVVAIVGGLALAGLVGALLSVPVLAVISAAIRSLSSTRESPVLAETTEPATPD